MNIKNRIKVSISNIPKAVKPIPGIHPNTINRVLNKPQDYEY